MKHLETEKSLPLRKVTTVNYNFVEERRDDSQSKRYAIPHISTHNQIYSTSHEIIIIVVIVVRVESIFLSLYANLAGN